MNAVIVRFASTHATDGWIAQTIETPVRTAKAAISASVPAPHARRPEWPSTSASAQRTPARRSRTISVVVTGFSCSPPLAPRATAAIPAPSARVSSGSTDPAKRGRPGVEPAAGSGGGPAADVRACDGRGHAEPGR